MTDLVLASKSVARAAVLKGAGLTFTQVASPINEQAVKDSLVQGGANPKQVALSLAEVKAVEASRHTDALVIGADQTLELTGHLVDKATSLEEARLRLLHMRGRDHHLHSGLALACAGEVLWSQTETASLRVRMFSDQWLDGYLARNGEALLSSVGCYMLEGEGVQLFDAIKGDYFTILGLPLLPLLEVLRARGVVES
ncbi:MAG: Maf family protein [Asticcacaulis sp.]